jgi:hydrogenase maturation protein HypF
MNAPSTPIARRRLLVRGIVQGVGFRPFVFNLAQRFGLMGFVGNNSSGVFIEIEGSADALAQFQRALVDEKPPLAMIDSIISDAMPPRGDNTFVIVESERQAQLSTPISPDICICDDCLRELFDPNDRRYRYPFINCTHCGPRFTIIKDIPYDRPLTTMAAFSMCPDCAREYHDLTNRRFHAQPIACPKCGPHVRYLQLVMGEQAGVIQGDAAIRATQQALREGAIVAVKGVGGFHLVCDALNDAAVRNLRERKGRADKPFALMVRDLDAARQLAEVSDEEAALMTSKERPIVLLRQRLHSAAASPLIAPGNNFIGIMLPYSPLHYLLLQKMPPLVMTSGNLSDEPICKDDDEALARLANIADAFLLHDREIHIGCDDSVVRLPPHPNPLPKGAREQGHELPIRRSRGYAPYPIKLPRPNQPSTPTSTLAVGGELKATFCLTNNDYAYMSQHIGDLENLETMQTFENSVEHFIKLFRGQPQRVVCDLHPGYLSGQWAQTYAHRHGLPLVKVQHHHAHIAALMAEHGLGGTQPIIGVAFDGSGYGTDGAIWGGEVFIADFARCERFAHLQYVPLPGGDISVKRPYRTALAHLWAAGVAWDEALPCVAACPPTERRVLQQQLERNLNCAPTSSMGRLFDAVAALLGVRQTVTYEAQAAIEMEALCADGGQDGYMFEIVNNASLQIDPSPMLHGIIADMRVGMSKAVMVSKVHTACAELILNLCLRARAVTRLNTVGLSGGVFQNVRLLSLAQQCLTQQGFEVLMHRRVPPNDGGLALGQACIG